MSAMANTLPLQLPSRGEEIGAPQPRPVKVHGNRHEPGSKARTLMANGILNRPRVKSQNADAVASGMGWIAELDAMNQPLHDAHVDSETRLSNLKQFESALDKIKAFGSLEPTVLDVIAGYHQGYHENKPRKVIPADFAPADSHSSRSTSYLFAHTR